MTYGEFFALCLQEWRSEARADVTSLRLTDESYLELCEDLIAEGADYELNVLPKGSLAKGVRPTVRCVQNPVTRGVVHLHGGADADAAEVFTAAEFRTVAVA